MEHHSFEWTSACLNKKRMTTWSMWGRSSKLRLSATLKMCCEYPNQPDLWHLWHFGRLNSAILRVNSSIWVGQQSQHPPDFGGNWSPGRSPAGFYQRNGLQNTLGRRTIELATFMSSQGWAGAEHEGFSTVFCWIFWSIFSKKIRLQVKCLFFFSFT